MDSRYVAVHLFHPGQLRSPHIVHAFLMSRNEVLFAVVAQFDFLKCLIHTAASAR